MSQTEPIGLASTCMPGFAAAPSVLMSSRSAARPGRRSLHPPDVVGPPGLVEPRFEGAIEAQDREPGPAGDRLHPVAFLAGRRLRAEVHVHRAVGVHLQRLVLAAEVARVQPCPASVYRISAGEAARYTRR